jgi:hypothetical protein
MRRRVTFMAFLLLVAGCAARSRPSAPGPQAPAWKFPCPSFGGTWEATSGATNMFKIDQRGCEELTMTGIRPASPPFTMQADSVWQEFPCGTEAKKDSQCFYRALFGTEHFEREMVIRHGRDVEGWHLLTIRRVPQNAQIVISDEDKTRTPPARRSFLAKSPDH